MKSLDGRAARIRSNALGWGNSEGTEGSLRQNSEKHVEQRRVDRPHQVWERNKTRQRRLRYSEMTRPRV